MKKLFIFLIAGALLCGSMFGQAQSNERYDTGWVTRAGRSLVPAGVLLNTGTVPLTANWPMGAFTLSQATWQGVAVAAAYGGTGQTVYAVGDLLYASTTTALSKRASVAVGQVFTSGGVGVAPAWSGNPSVASLVLTDTGTLASTLGNVSLTTALTAASGNEAAFTLTGTVNKAAGNDTILAVNQVDTASPGVSLLADFQVGTVSVARIVNDGKLYADKIYIEGYKLYFGIAGHNNGLIYGGQPSATTGDCLTFVPGGATALSNTSGTRAGVAITSLYNQTSGTAANTDILINRTETAIGSGTQKLISAQVESVERFGVSNKGAITSTMINNADSDTDEVDSVVFAGGYGMVIAASTTDGTSAIWKLKGTVFEAIEVDADWTATKDGAGTYNVYIESGAIKLQNKVGDNKAVKLGYFGI